jgi:hypothetical protein
MTHFSGEQAEIRRYALSSVILISIASKVYWSIHDEARPPNHGRR